MCFDSDKAYNLQKWLHCPIPDFRSPKTLQVIRHIGIERLVLESDHEDAVLVPDSMEAGIDYLAEALQVNRDTLVERTTRNALQFYNLV
jgi:Tat protein secretion system quality control protein TatD with DNase activity